MINRLRGHYMHHFWQEVYDYRLPIGVVAWQVFSAFIVTLPPKGQPYNAYDHLYDFSHQLLNIRPGK